MLSNALQFATFDIIAWAVCNYIRALRWVAHIIMQVDELINELLQTLVSGSGSEMPTSVSSKQQASTLDSTAKHRGRLAALVSGRQATNFLGKA